LEKKRKKQKDIIEEKKDSESLIRVNKIESRIETLENQLKTTEEKYKSLSGGIRGTSGRS